VTFDFLAEENALCPLLAGKVDCTFADYGLAGGRFTRHAFARPYQVGAYQMP
jgi:hypothetical protein